MFDSYIKAVDIINDLENFEKYEIDTYSYQFILAYLDSNMKKFNKKLITRFVTANFILIDEDTFRNGVYFICKYDLNVDVVNLIYFYQKFNNNTVRHTLLILNRPIGEINIKCKPIKILNKLWNKLLDNDFLIYNYLNSCKKIKEFIDFVVEHKNDKFTINPVQLKCMLYVNQGHKYNFANLLSEEEQKIIYSKLNIREQDVLNCLPIFKLLDKAITPYMQMCYFSDFHKYNNETLMEIYPFMHESVQEKINKIIKTRIVTEKLEE